MVVEGRHTSPWHPFSYLCHLGFTILGELGALFIIYLSCHHPMCFSFFWDHFSPFKETRFLKKLLLESYCIMLMRVTRLCLLIAYYLFIHSLIFSTNIHWMPLMFQVQFRHRGYNWTKAAKSLPSWGSVNNKIHSFRQLRWRLRKQERRWIATRMWGYGDCRQDRCSLEGDVWVEARVNWGRELYRDPREGH